MNTLKKITLNLKELSTINIGYETENFFLLSSKDYEKKGLKFLKNLDKYYFIGGCSNILFHNRDKKASFISLNSDFDDILFELNEDQNLIKVSSSFPSAMLSLIGLLFGIKEYKFLHLLPGSIGGAVYMNARAYGGEIKDIFYSAEAFDSESFKLLLINKKETDFQYKKSIFQNNRYFIINSNFIFNFLYGDKREKKNIEKIIKIFIRFILKSKKLLIRGNLKNFLNIYTIKRIKEFLDFIKNYSYSKILFSTKLNNLRNNILNDWEAIEKDRIFKKHFDFPSLGSIFKNNYSIGKPMGKIIDELGLKGTKKNDAMISKHHGNIIINIGNATSDDVLFLIDLIKEKVYKNYNFVPEIEIKII